MLTKKDFVKLADYLRPIHNSGKLSYEAECAIIRFCQASNPNFLQDRFISYLKGDGTQKIVKL